MTSINCVALSAMLVLCCAAANAAVRPTEPPSMGIIVDAGDYTVRGRSVSVAKTYELTVQEPTKVSAVGEEHVLGDDKPQGYFGGTALKNTFGPIDTGIRMLYSIDPSSVKVKSQDAKVYEEGKDYFLDHDWGGISRIETGAIAKDAKVYVDYAVHWERVDAVQVSQAGGVSIKQGVPKPVCSVAPEPDAGCTVLANLYISYRCDKITDYSIRPSPVKDITWREFIKTSGRKNLNHTLSLLRDNKPVTVVCWGDSVTAGCSPSSPDKAYVELLRAALKTEYPKGEIKVINAGIGGSNTESRHDGYDKEVLDLKPDLITVEFVNDCGFPAEKVKSNWAEFITRARAKNPNVEFILITPHYMAPGWMGGYNASVGAMRNAAVLNKVALADAGNIWQNLRNVGIPYETLLANVLNHPNDLGHEFFLASIMKLLQAGK